MPEETAFTSLGWQALIVMKRLNEVRLSSFTGKDGNRLASGSLEEAGRKGTNNKPLDERTEEKGRERERSTGKVPDARGGSMARRGS